MDNRGSRKVYYRRFLGGECWFTGFQTNRAHESRPAVDPGPKSIATPSVNFLVGAAKVRCLVTSPAVTNPRAKEPTQNMGIGVNWAKQAWYSGVLRGNHSLARSGKVPRCQPLQPSWYCYLLAVARNELIVVSQYCAGRAVRLRRRQGDMVIMQKDSYSHWWLPSSNHLRNRGFQALV